MSIVVKGKLLAMRNKEGVYEASLPIDGQPPVVMLQKCSRKTPLLYDSYMNSKLDRPFSVWFGHGIYCKQFPPCLTSATLTLSYDASVCKTQVTSVEQLETIHNLMR